MAGCRLYGLVGTIEPRKRIGIPLTGLAISDTLCATRILSEASGVPADFRWPGILESRIASDCSKETGEA